MKRSVLIIAVAVALAGAACSSADDAATTTVPPATVATRDGGTVTVALENYPANLNLVLAGSAGTSRTVGAVLARGYRTTPELALEPWLFDGDCPVTSSEPYTVSCRIVAAARWSDGTDLSSADVQFTVNAINKPENNVLSRQGYDQVKEVVVKGPKQFDLVFNAPWPGWRTMFTLASGAVFPKHVLENADFNKAWQTCVCVPGTSTPIGSGPYLVTSFSPEALELSRNPGYWGPRPKLDKVVFKPYTSVDAQIAALREGQVDLIFPTTLTGTHKTLLDNAGVTLQSARGFGWEHLDLLSDVKGLDDPAVRKAIATALPRRELVDRLAKPIDPSTAVLQNVVYMPGQPGYQPHWQIYPEAGDAAAARQILERAGYTRTGSEPYAKGDVKLEFTLSVNAENEPRKTAQTVIAARLAEAGIRVKDDNVPNTNALLGPGRFQMVLFSWTTGTDPAGTTFWRDDIPPGQPTQNYTKVRNPELTKLIIAADRELDGAKRTTMYNQVDEILARDVVTSIPLFQRPVLVAFQGRLTGVAVNPTVDSFTWNVGSWALKA